MSTNAKRKDQLEALFNFLHTFDDEQFDISKVKMKLINEYLKELNESFNVEKPYKYLKDLIYSLPLERQKEIRRGNKGKFYRDNFPNFEGKKKEEPVTFKHYPTRDGLIKVCFDLDIRKIDAIDELFDRIYYNRLYLKNSEDLVYLFFLRKTNEGQDIAKQWYNEHIKDCQLLPKSVDDPSGIYKKYTAEIEKDFSDLQSEAELEQYLTENKNMFDNTISSQFTAKRSAEKTFQQLEEEFNFENGNNSEYNLVSALLCLNWSELEDKNDVGNMLLEKIRMSFGTYHTNEIYDLKKLGRQFIKSKYFVKGDCVDQRVERAKKDRDGYLQKLLDKTKKRGLDRGNYLLISLYQIEKDRNNNPFSSDEKFIDTVNRALDEAGFAPLDGESRLLDRIICDFIYGVVEQGETWVVELFTLFIEAITDGEFGLDPIN